ncbi:Conjugative transfer protein TrbJ (plasmid) [Acidisarcina polymorpha]|uniref:Conjugative transfer protein TrbJ n=1 Tax=Acidisarcina polymorpha TaxID=2211140 RepID=A0A2Z5GBT3_9BACT|nr:P-type conjugative transfer protein TrbJ [Acidisarcina polymorpha]AXC16439.1 Conjugative transfer protein TrbJ [Acidisarcina polymorpha]
MNCKWLYKATGAFTAGALLGTSAFFPSRAHAAAGLFATEYTQILNYVQLFGQLEKQVTMVENQLKELTNMATQGVTITDQLFGSVVNDISSLRQIVSTGQSLAYTLTNMDAQFKVRFPGYAPSTNYGQSYQQWSQTSLDSILGALKAAGLQNTQFDSEAATLNSLQAQSQSAVGRMQALEVGNEIADNEAQQLLKLRQLMMADIQSKAAFQSAMIQQQATDQANSDAFFAPNQVTSDGVSF